MKKSLLQVAVLAGLGVSGHALALGLDPLVAAPSGSAYINCYNDGRTSTAPRGNFGSYPIPSTELPSSTAFNKCAVVGLANDTAAPKTGYTLAASTTRTVPTTTGGTGNIGNVVDRVWRKPAATAPVTTTDMCIFGAKFTAISADHDSATTGTQFFEVNDIARGGFSSSGTVNVGYFLQATNASPVYRAGRTFTSVQHRSLKYDTTANKALNGTNYVDLPTIGGSGPNIIGENVAIASTTTATTTAANQQASVNSNWVDFTLDAVFTDDDGSTNPVSAMTYVEAPCDSSAVSGWVKSGAIRLRQTAQELTTFKEIAIDGYAPPGATVP